MQDQKRLVKMPTHVASSAQIGVDETVCKGTLMKGGLFISAGFEQCSCFNFKREEG